MSNYAISAIIPTYNRAHLITRSISSVLNQLSIEDELIVIDDGSTDDTAKVVAQFGDKVRYIKTTNQGVGAARNRGVREAKNPLVTFLDSDGQWIEGKTELQGNFLKASPDVLFCFSNHGVRSDDGEEKHFQLDTWHDDKRNWDEILGPGKPISGIIELPVGFQDFKYYVGDIYLSALLYGNYLNVNTLMARRQQAGDALRFAEDVNIYEEWECLARLAQKGKCAYLDCMTIWQTSHLGPRVSSADGFDRSCGKLTVMQRVWGKDKEFLQKHKKEYLGIYNSNRFIRAEGYMIRGKTREARSEFRGLPISIPLSYRLLSSLPGLVVNKLLKIRKKLKG